MTELTPRDAKGLYTATIETGIRDAEAAKLHARGWTYTRIGEHFKVSKQGAYSMVQRALTAAGKTVREEALAAELLKLDMREQVLLEVLARRHVVVNNGKVIHLDGVPLEDDGAVISTIDALGRVFDQRAKLLGLYAPTKSQVTVTDSMAAEIERLAAELGVNDAVESSVG